MLRLAYPKNRRMREQVLQQVPRKYKKSIKDGADNHAHNLHRPFLQRMHTGRDFIPSPTYREAEPMLTNSLVKKVIRNKRGQVENNAWFEDRSLRTTHSQECPWLCAHHQGTGVCGSLGDNPRESQVFGKTLDEDQHQLSLPAQQTPGPRP